MASERSDYANPTISRWETGQRSPSEADLASYCTTLGMSAKERNDLVAALRKRSDPLWIATADAEQRHQFATMVELERSARDITVVSPLLVPGLLQTSEYTRAMMERGGIPPTEVTTRVAVRMWRRDALTRRHPANLLAIVGESALRQRIGGPAVMLDQLRYLVAAGAMRNVDLRVIADDNDWHPGLEGAFVLVEFVDRPPVVQIENRRAAMYFDQEPDVEVYQRAADMVASMAMSPDESHRIIAAAVSTAERRWGLDERSTEADL